MHVLVFSELLLGVGGGGGGEGASMRSPRDTDEVCATIRAYPTTRILTV